MATLTTYVFYDSKNLKKVTVEILELGLETGEGRTSLTASDGIAYYTQLTSLLHIHLKLIIYMYHSS